MKEGRINIFTPSISAQSMGNDGFFEECYDDEIGYYISPIPCEDEIGICACPECDYSGSCDDVDMHFMEVHLSSGELDNGDGEGDGDGDESGGSSGGGGGGSGSNSGGSSSGGSSGHQLTPTKIMSAAKAAVASIPGLDAQCNKGVQKAYKNLFGTIPKGMQCQANEMIAYWQINSSVWITISMSMTQLYANQGYFVVAWWINPNGHGHVVVITPGMNIIAMDGVVKFHVLWILAVDTDGLLETLPIVSASTKKDKLNSSYINDL